MAKDFIRRGGAEKLKEQIENYWYMRGYKVEARLQSRSEVTERATFDIRSDMVGGLPVRRL